MKVKLRFSDAALDKAIRFSKGAELWCKSGIAFWGAGVAIGVGALALHAVLPVPAVLGTSAIVTSGLMCAKSVVLDRVFHALHKKGMQERDARYKARGRPAPELPLFSFGKNFPKARQMFQAKAQPCINKILKQPLVLKTNTRLKTAMANANSRLRF